MVLKWDGNGAKPVIEGKSKGFPAKWYCAVMICDAFSGSSAVLSLKKCKMVHA